MPYGVNAMYITLTLGKISDILYERLKSAAWMHRRSMNNEAIARLEAVLVPTKLTSSERLARVRAHLHHFLMWEAIHSASILSVAHSERSG